MTEDLRPFQERWHLLTWQQLTITAHKNIKSQKSKRIFKYPHRIPLQCLILLYILWTTVLVAIVNLTLSVSAIKLQCTLV